MTPDQLEMAGIALYGPRWQTNLARALKVSDRHMRRLAAGIRPVNDAMRRDIAAMCKLRSVALTGIARELRSAR